MLSTRDSRRTGLLPVRPWLGIAVALTGVVAAWPFAAGARSADEWPPAALSDTGLYSDWSSKTVAPEHIPFSPQYPLWSDGATKARWMSLPAGTFIDASNPDAWQFPVGTRLWKEFRFGRRAETRFIEHTSEGWQFAAYVWNEDETEAPLAPERGIRQSVRIRDGVRHSIPSRSDCRACHEASPVRVLGVSLLQLSPDRDPGAPHREQPPPGSAVLTDLVARGLVRGLPPTMPSAPAIAASSPTARAALGYLHANCGGCHTGAGDLSSLSFALNYTFSRPIDEAPPALLTTLGRLSHFTTAELPETVERVHGGRPDLSMLVARMSSRNPAIQMPPLGTHIVDDEALVLIRRWIGEDLATAR